MTGYLSGISNLNNTKYLYYNNLAFIELTFQKKNNEIQKIKSRKLKENNDYKINKMTKEAKFDTFFSRIDQNTVKSGAIFNKKMSLTKSTLQSAQV
mgnify:CR=1 FL=1